VPGTRSRFTVESPGVKAARIVSLAPGLLLLATLLAGGCQRSIGDQCQTSIDCDPNGARQCDLSQPGGYCTIQGCSETSCPSDSACIRYFPAQYLTTICNPTCEDRCHPDCSAADGGADDGGAPDGRCPIVCEDPNAGCNASNMDQCTADELCLTAGRCARRELEQRACAKTCGSNGDCRGGYECRPAGTQGSMLLAQNPGATASFCAPMAP